MNILIAADHAAYKGNIAGIGRYLLNILPLINRTRFKLFAVILRSATPLKTSFKDHGIRIIGLRRRKFDPFTIYDFVKIIREERIDLLHLHQYGASNFGRIAGKITGVPTILHAHDTVYSYPTYQWVVDRLLTKHTHCTISVSEAVKNACVKKRAISPDKIIVMPNGIPLEHFKPWPPKECQVLKVQFKIPLDAPIVGTLTRFHEVKGNRYLIDAATEVLKIFSNTRFLLVGNGPLLGQLKEYVRKLGIENNVIFTGFQRDVLGMLSLFDVKVIASLAEGHPQALLEAMAMGKAVVATKVGGVDEILMSGDTGLLVPPRDPHALADKIIHLLQNEQERVCMGVSARNACKNYSLDKYVDNLEKLYEQLVV